MARKESLATLFVTIGLEDKDLQKGLKNAQKHIQAWSKGMAIAGGVITAALGLATKAALEEEVGINRLSAALKAVGADYGALKSEIEESIAATQAKTNYADDQQREALIELIGITGTYQGALEQLRLATDLAAAKDMDLVSAAALVGRAVTGNTELLARYGIQVKKGATAVEVLAMMQDRFAGAAEGAANPLTQLKNSVGDLVESVGSLLVPLLKSVVNRILPVINGIKEWIAEHPRLAQVLTIAAAALGLMLTGLGMLGMALPVIARGLTAVIKLFHLQAAASKVAAAAQWLWNVAMSANPILLIIESIAALVIGIIALARNWQKIVELFTGGADEAAKAMGRWAESVRASAERMVSDIEMAFNKWESLARKAAEGIIKGIDKQIAAARDAHKVRMELLEEEELAALAAVDEEAAARIAQLRGEKQLIDAELETRRRAKRKEEEEARIAELNALIAAETDAGARAGLEKELADYIAEVQSSRWEQEQQDRLDALDDAIDVTQQSADHEKKIIEASYAEQKKLEETKAQERIDLLEAQKIAVEGAFKEQAELYQGDLEAFRALNDGKLEDARRFVDEYNRIMGGIGGEPMGITPPAEEPKADMWSVIKGMFSGIGIPSFQGWEGPVPGRLGAPVAAIVHGGEIIRQPGRGAAAGGVKSIVNNFNIASLVVREKADAERIAREIYRIQQLRI